MSNQAQAQFAKYETPARYSVSNIDLGLWMVLIAGSFKSYNLDVRISKLEQLYFWKRLQTFKISIFTEPLTGLTESFEALNN